MEMLINGALMTTACTLLLGALLIYRTLGHEELRQLRQGYLEKLQTLPGGQSVQPSPEKGVNPKNNLKIQLRQLQQRQRGLDNQVLGVSIALLCFVASVLMLAFSVLIPWLWFVKISLWLFVGGSGCLLWAVFVNLVQLCRDYRQDHHPEHRPEHRRDYRSDGRSDSRSDGHPDHRSEHRSEYRRQDHRREPQVVAINLTPELGASSQQLGLSSQVKR